MKQAITLGVVCLTRNTFDYETAAKLYANILADLRQLPQVQLVAEETPIMEVPEALAAGHRLAAAQVDAMVVISGTFHLGHLVLELKKLCDKPLLLWGLPELPYNGGKIRLNSVCGVNLNASNLYKSGIRDYTYTVGDRMDENWVDAIRMRKSLQEAHIGIIGYRAHGFFNVGVDELALYGKFGVLIDHYELQDLWDLEPESGYLTHYAEKMGTQFDCGALNEAQKEKVVALAAKLRTFAEKYALTAIALRCWPEWASGFGIAPCASMSLVQSDGILLSCEGDIDCAVTMICHRAAGADTPFMADLSQVNVEDNSALMWHDGVAPCNLSAGDSTMDTYHCGGRGVTAGFVLKTGEINMARLDSVGGTYRLFQQRGEAIPMEKLLAGTYAKVRFDLPMQTILDQVIYHGIAHHVSMVYGDYTQAFRIFARLADIEVL